MIELSEYGIDTLFHMPVGSRVTCNPAPTDTDEDWLCKVTNLDTFIDQAIAAGFTLDGSLNQGVIAGEADTASKSGLFASVSRKSDNLNLIATSNGVFFDRFVLATHVCKHLNVLPKDHRIAVFQAILYGHMYE